MKQHLGKRVLPLALILCLLMSLFPCIGIMSTAAAAETGEQNEMPVPLAAGDYVYDEDSLRAAIQTLSKIQLAATKITISAPIEIPANTSITISGLGVGKSIIEANIKSDWSSSTAGIFVLAEGAELILEKFTIDGSKTARCILVNEGESNLELTNVTIQNGASTGAVSSAS